jgi:hypothetical protein
MYLESHLCRRNFIYHIFHTEHPGLHARKLHRAAEIGIDFRHHSYINYGLYFGVASNYVR